MSGSNLSEGIWCGQSIFGNTNKLKSSNEKVKKLQKLINEVQKKTKQNRKKQKVYFMPESIEYAHRKCEKVNTQKIKQSYRILEYPEFCSGQVKCC